MGDAWARTEEQWWPEDSQPVDSDPGMIVVNIYVPLANFPDLEDQYDAIPPDGDDDIFLLWNQVKRGEKRYDSGNFLGLIKDALLPQIPELFGGLPDGEGFVKKLTRFFEDHVLYNDSMLLINEGQFNLYVCPLERNAAPASKLVELAQAYIQSRATLLRNAGEVESATALGQLEFRFAAPPAEEDLSEDDPAMYALEDASDLLIEMLPLDQNWMDVLYEACYGIAASFDLRDWLVSDWCDTDVNFEPSYEFWKAGGEFTINEKVCYVYQTEMRSDSD